MKDPSQVLSIHVTDLCNSSCVFCVVGIPERKGESIFPEEIRRTLVENAGRGYQAVNLHGGEPTIHPHFLGILERIKSLGYPEVHLQTNGRRMADAEFVRQMRTLNVNLFIISMHGLTAATHEALTRGEGGFEETMEGIRNAKRYGGKVRTNTVLSRQNLSELPALTDMLIDEGVDHINISNMHPVETAYLHFEEVTPTLAGIQRWLPIAVERALARRVTVTLEGFSYCMVPGLESYMLQYRKVGMQIRGLWIDDYDRFMDQVCRVKGKICEDCSCDNVCGGVYREYIEKRGWEEFTPVAHLPAEPRVNQ